MSNGNSVTNFTSFDTMGRVLKSAQTTGGQVFPFVYTYNLAGGLNTEEYPSGRVVTLTYDAGNRPIQVQGLLAGQTTNYVSSVSYAPNSAPSSVAYGNGLTRTFAYNWRNQPTSIVDATSASTLLQLALNWGDGSAAVSHNIGRLRSQQILTPSASFTQNYAYDPLKRLQSVTDTAAGTTLTRNFNYDQYGNNWLARNDNGLPYNPLTPTAASNYGANNRLTLPTSGYDQMGNQTTSGSYVYSYDAENRVYLANDTVAPVGFLAMFYDGMGQRIQKQLSSSAITTYVYDAFGQLADEYSNFSLALSCTTCYLSTDHLGSTRLVTDSGGNVMTRHDFMPFGDEITGMGRSSVWGSAADGVSQKFTGQQRDEGQGLDFFNARYLYSALGRFTSPDPLSAGADPAEPQSWNGYAYVNNNPLSDVDLDGLGACGNGQGACDSGSSGQAGAGSGQVSVAPSVGFQLGGGVVVGASGAAGSSVQFAPDVSWFGDVGKSVYNNFADLAEGIINMPNPDVPIPTGPWISLPRATIHSRSADFTGAVLTMLIPIGGEEAAAAKGELSFGRKLDFLFDRGIDQSNVYSAARAAGNAARIGIADTPLNRKLITQLFKNAYRDSSSIVGPGSIPGSLLREFFLPGVTGTGSKIQFVELGGKVITIIAK